MSLNPLSLPCVLSPPFLPCASLAPLCNVLITLRIAGRHHASLRLPEGLTWGNILYVDLFIHMCYGTMEFFDSIVQATSNALTSKRMKPTTREELLRLHGILFYMMAFPVEGPKRQYFNSGYHDAVEDDGPPGLVDDFSSDDEDGYGGDVDGEDDSDNEDFIGRHTWKSAAGVIVPTHNLGQWMSYWRFRSLCTYLALPSYGNAEDPLMASENSSSTGT